MFFNQLKLKTTSKVSNKKNQDLRLQKIQKSYKNKEKLRFKTKQKGTKNKQDHKQTIKENK
jgi:hypothetical protein